MLPMTQILELQKQNKELRAKLAECQKERGTAPLPYVMPVPIRECPNCGYKTFLKNEDDEFDWIVNDNIEKSLESDELREACQMALEVLENAPTYPGRNQAIAELREVLE